MRTTDSRSAEPQMAERQEAAQFAAVSHHCDVTGSGDMYFPTGRQKAKKKPNWSGKSGPTGDKCGEARVRFRS